MPSPIRIRDGIDGDQVSETVTMLTQGTWFIRFRVAWHPPSWPGVRNGGTAEHDAAITLCLDAILCRETDVLITTQMKHVCGLQYAKCTIARGGVDGGGRMM